MFFWKRAIIQNEVLQNSQSNFEDSSITDETPTNCKLHILILPYIGLKGELLLKYLRNGSYHN